MASFSSQTKAEVCRIKLKNACCRRAELNALLLFGGVIGIRRGGMILTLSSSLEPVAKRMLWLIRNHYAAPVDIRRVEKEHFNGMERMELVLSGEDARQAMFDCGLLTREGEDYAFTEGIVLPPEKPCCADAFLRGVFLTCGTMQPPEKGYHLEFVLDSTALANDLCGLLFDSGINAHLTKRREKTVVYLKEADSIAAFLGRIGAHNAYLQMEDARMVREIKNEVNRSVNCATANINKTTEASLRQIRAIELLEREGILREQTLPIRQTAEMRLEYPEASLEELAAMSSVSRSGINHRLRKLMELADTLGGVD